MTLFLSAVIIILLISLILKMGILDNLQSKSGSYNTIESLFTPAELKFYHHLNKINNQRYSIFGKVRVADVLSTNKTGNKSTDTISQNKINSKHLDFILCDIATSKIICAIELDDKSHNAKHRQDRDSFLNNACTQAGLKLFRIKAQAEYNNEDTMQILKEIFPKTTEIDNSLSVEEINSQLNNLHQNQIDPIQNNSSPSPITTENRNCPKCNSSMIIRTAQKGPNTGKKFWACTQYPKCKCIQEIALPPQV